MSEPSDNYFDPVEAGWSQELIDETNKRVRISNERYLESLKDLPIKGKRKIKTQNNESR